MPGGAITRASAMEPMELLEVVFPLLVDQQRFVVLAMRQEDLAQRMAALKGHDGEDDPALKTRMRDLEHEQRQIRRELWTRCWATSRTTPRGCPSGRS